MRSWSFNHISDIIPICIHVIYIIWNHVYRMTPLFFGASNFWICMCMSNVCFQVRYRSSIHPMVMNLQHNPPTGIDIEKKYRVECDHFLIIISNYSIQRLPMTLAIIGTPRYRYTFQVFWHNPSSLSEIKMFDDRTIRTKYENGKMYRYKSDEAGNLL